LDKEFQKLEAEAKRGETKIGVDETEKKSKKGRPKKETFSVEEIQEKLSATFNTFSFLAKIDKDYKPGDFLAEAKDIVRLSQKYAFLHTALVLLDPLFLVLSLGKKAMELVKIVRRRKTDDHKPAGDGPTPGILWHDGQR